MLASDTFRDQLQTEIDFHQTEADRLKAWRDGLDAEAFDWRQTTLEDQWKIHNLKFERSR